MLGDAMPATLAHDEQDSDLTTVAPAAAAAESAATATAESSTRAAHPTREPSSAKNTKGVPRLKWTNSMVADMLRLRFEDGEVKRRLETADTKMKKALAWQQFASVLSQSQGVVISQAQLYQKYRKVKCIYRKGRRERRQTGNDTSEPFAVDEGLWAVLNDAFATRVGLSGEVLVDTHLDEDAPDDAATAESNDSKSTLPAKGKLQPVVELANALQTGMEAIAAAMNTAPKEGAHIQQLANSFDQRRLAISCW